MRINFDDIPVIDLFAGPGGLSEGFASYSPDSKNNHPFKISASVEMDTFAHKTLELRSFFHEFLSGRVPEAYYKYLRNEISREELFKKYPHEAAKAQKKAIKATLGTADDKFIYQRIEEELSQYKGKPWVLIGGPPCQAYSLIGRSRRQANGKGHENQQNDKRNFLYLEYLRILAKFQPMVFVMENVKGMLSAQINGEKIVDKIFADLRSPGKAIKIDSESSNNRELEYRIYSLVTEAESDKDLNPEDYLIKSEDFGIPQTRHRVILLGIRSDILIKPQILKTKSKVSVKDVISDLPPLRSSLSKTTDLKGEWYGFIKTILTQDWYKNYHPAITNGRSIDTQKLKKHMKDAIIRMNQNLNTGNKYIEKIIDPKYKPEWFLDRRLKGVINHETRGHMKEDLWRYFFSSVYTEICGYSPRMKDFPKQLLPAHKNAQKAVERGYFEDRFRVQAANHPAATITCHIAKDGHYSIHYDPTQCRSLTVREAARIQTFPDNYYFEGPRTQQFHQVGNAVPPLLAIQIAEVVFKVIERSVIKDEEVHKNNLNIKSSINYETQ